MKAGGGAVETVCPREFEETKQELERVKAGGGAVETICPREFEEMKQELERVKAGGGVLESEVSSLISFLYSSNVNLFYQELATTKQELAKTKRELVITEQKCIDVGGFKRSLDQMVKTSREETRLLNLEVSALKAELSSNGAAVVAGLKASLAAKEAERDQATEMFYSAVKDAERADNETRTSRAEVVELKQELDEVRRSVTDTPEVKRLTDLVREKESRLEKITKEAETKNRMLAQQVVVV